MRYEAPNSVQSAVALLRGDANARVLAGGTDLLVQFRAGARQPTAFVDVKRIPELIAHRRSTPTGLRLGAATSGRRDLASTTKLRQLWPGLAEAVAI